MCLALLVSLKKLDVLQGKCCDGYADILYYLADICDISVQSPNVSWQFPVATYLRVTSSRSSGGIRRSVEEVMPKLHECCNIDGQPPLSTLYKILFHYCITRQVQYSAVFSTLQSHPRYSHTFSLPRFQPFVFYSLKLYSIQLFCYWKLVAAPVFSPEDHGHKLWKSCVSAKILCRSTK